MTEYIITVRRLPRRVQPYTQPPNETDPSWERTKDRLVRRSMEQILLSVGTDEHEMSEPRADSWCSCGWSHSYEWDEAKFKIDGNGFPNGYLKDARERAVAHIVEQYGGDIEQAVLAAFDHHDLRRTLSALGGPSPPNINGLVSFLAQNS